MKSLILHNIISSNTVFKLNHYISSHRSELGQTQVWFCATTEDNRRWKLHEPFHFPYTVLPHFSLRLRGSDLFTYFINPTIWSQLNAHRPDQIIVCGWDLFAYQAAFIWARLHRRRITLWSGSTVGEPSWRRSLTLPLVHLFIRWSHDFIAYGTRAKEYLSSLGADPAHITIFPNDVNAGYFRRQAQKFRPQKSRLKHQLGLHCSKNFIFCGQLIARKGVEELLTSYSQFRKHHADWGLVIVGYGQLEHRLKQRVNQEKIPDVVFLGAVEQYDLPRIYVACDCLVLPSREEVWGLVVNEALYCGLKVIVSERCGAAVDLVTPENGIITPSDIAGLTRALTQMAGKLI